MPLLQPKLDETYDAFIARCLGDEAMNRESPDPKRRAAICQTPWRFDELTAPSLSSGRSV